VIRFLARRLAGSSLVLLGLTVITFVLARVIPSNAAAIYIGPHARPDDIARVTIQLGLDKPLPIQYLKYMAAMLSGDWGTSIGTKRPVLDEILHRLPASLELITAAMVLAIPLGIILGLVAARWRGRPPDAIVRLTSIIGVSMPAFFLGLVLQIIFFSVLHLFPLIGRVDSDLRFTNPIAPVTGFYTIDALLGGNVAGFLDVLSHLFLPALTLAAYPIAVIARMMRASTLETLALDHVRTARAYGIGEGKILRRLVLRNALLPVLSVIGLTLAYSLTGTFFVEIVYSWPGLGTFTVQSILNVDYPSIMGITLLGAVGYVTINLLVDLGQAWLDPRIRTAS
jgi:peptide/nickel transport system permease protein